MYANEKTPLKGSGGYVPYSFMSDRHGALRRKMKQYQCLICASLTLTFALLIVLVFLSYPEAREVAYDDIDSPSNLLQKPLKKATLGVGSPVLNAASPKLGAEDFPTPESLRKAKQASSSDVRDVRKPTGCIKSKYRSTDGSCNNLAQPTWGASGQPLKELIPPDYCDGLSSPRCSVTNFELPSPYLITSKIKSWDGYWWPQHKNGLSNITKLLWGKFLYQDLVDTAQYGPERINLATAFIDGSNIYGYSNVAERKLRTFVDGKLVEDQYKGYKDSSLNKDEECQNGFLNFELFNKVMIKQHNSITSELKLINPHWNDEKLYLEAKRIVIAQIQHVTYSQFLESIIGERQMEEFDLKLQNSGFNNKYSQSVDPSVSSVFATAVFKSFFAKLPKARMELKNDHCDYYAIAHGIQRGRDFGIPGYIKWREFCGLPQPTGFEELPQLIGINNTEIMKAIYIDIDDIDLLVGIFSEIPAEGSMFGEVGMCLMADQFKRLKVGDRYWYEVDEIPQRFSEEQLMEVRKTTISKLMCDNLGTEEIFLSTGVSLECSAVPKINLTPWIENEVIENNPASIIHRTPSNVIVNLSNSNKNLNEVTRRQERIYGDSNLMQSLNHNVLSIKNKTTVVKRSVSFTVNMANITMESTNGTSVYEVYNQKPPILFPLDRVIDPNAYTPGTDIYFTGTIVDNLLAGSFALPLRNIDGSKGQSDSLAVRFQADVSFKWGATFELDGNEKYNCKVLFQSYTKSSNPNINERNGLASSLVLTEEVKTTEQCTIMLIGMFYERPFYCSLIPWWCLEGKLFYWSGDTKIAMKSIPIPLNDLNVSKIKTGDLKLNSIKQKTDNVKVDKLFASVTIVRAQISGSFDNENVIEVPVTPPMDIYLDHLISPSAYDDSFEVTWSGTPINDSTVIGKFSIPYYTDIGTALKKTFTANFTFDIVYKFGGSIGIINPSKTYTCKLMFPSIKKSTVGNQKLSQNEILPVHTIKGKTPFGESCAIMLSGYYKKSSVFCYLTPWWCSDEKVFHWNGVAELTLKYKYNISDSENNNFINKQAEKGVGKSQNFVMTSPFQYNSGDFEEKFCCGHRLGGKVRGGWLEIKNSGFFQSSKTIWSGELPTAIELPIFWKPEQINDQIELSDVFGHEVVWSCSIFQSTMQGSFLFPQYVGHGPPPLVNWIKGNFLMELIPEDNVPLSSIVVPGMSYRSRVNFRNAHSPDPLPFSSPQKGGPVNEDVYSGIKAPLILLGKYSSDHKSFIWNGSFIIIFTKSASDFMLF